MSEHPEFCPHAGPHVYCETCRITPCPMGLVSPDDPLLKAREKFEADLAWIKFKNTKPRGEPER